MDLYIFKGKDFHINGKLSIKVYQKPENRYMYVPFKSTTPDILFKLYIGWVEKVCQDKHGWTQFFENKK